MLRMFLSVFCKYFPLNGFPKSSSGSFITLSSWLPSVCAQQQMTLTFCGYASWNGKLHQDFLQSHGKFNSYFHSFLSSSSSLAPVFYCPTAIPYSFLWLCFLLSLEVVMWMSFISCSSLPNISEIRLLTFVQHWQWCCIGSTAWN